MRKYALNENFFSDWSENMAYMLGFIVADGCIYKKPNKPNSYSISIGLHEKDNHILESFCSFCETDHPIYKYKNRTQVQLVLNSAIIAQDLMSLDVYPRKSLTAKWVSNIPEEYMSHYMRGFFDGDGSVFLIKHPSAKRNYIGMNFIGTLDYLEGVQKEVNKIIGREYGCMRELKIKSGFYYQLAYSGDSTIKKFTDWIYKDSDEETRLSRKFSIVKDHFSNLTPEQILDQRATFIRPENIHETYLFMIEDEWLTLSQMTALEECIVPRQTLYHRIVVLGLDPITAMTTELGAIPPSETPNIENGKLANNSKINWDMSKSIRQDKITYNYTNEALAELYNISISSVHDLILGRTWLDPNYNPVHKKSVSVIKHAFYGNQSTLSEISNITGVPKATIDRRLREGKTLEQATIVGRIDIKEELA